MAPVPSLLLCSVALAALVANAAVPDGDGPTFRRRGQFGDNGPFFHRKGLRSLPLSHATGETQPASGLVGLRGGGGSSASGMMVFLWKALLDSTIATMPFLGQIYTANMKNQLLSDMSSSRTKGEVSQKVAMSLGTAVPFAFALAPLENLRQEKAAAGGDVLKASSTLWQRDGPFGFMRGVWLLVAQAFAEFGIFALVELIAAKHLLNKKNLSDDEKAWMKFAASMIAVLASAIVSTPINNIGARMAAAKKPMSEQMGCGALDSVATFKDIFRSEGVPGLYKGIQASLFAKLKAFLWAHIMAAKIQKAFAK